MTYDRRRRTMRVMAIVQSGHVGISSARWHRRSLFGGRLLLGTPKPLDGTLDTALGRHGDLSQAEQSNGTDAGRGDPRRSQERLADLRDVVRHDIIQPDPGMGGYVDGHEDTERLVHEPIGPGIGHHEHGGGGHDQEGRHGMMGVGGGRTGISVERSRRFGGEGPPLGGRGRRSSGEEGRGLSLCYAEHNDSIRWTGVVRWVWSDRRGSSGIFFFQSFCGSFVVGEASPCSPK